ncbi:MAG: class I poly(R)-hydroxyalkanoic acid synthase [Bacteriovorax sp.]|nr:class I poly(R)-hydroxyalkanoic acid synthase [Rhizobacter sp.]
MSDIWKSVSGLSLPLPAVADLQKAYLQQSSELWNQTLMAGKAGAGAAAVAAPADRRFSGQGWAANPAAAYTAQMYLLNSRTLMQMADSLQGDEKTRQRIRFAVQQWIDAASPSNYLALNPDAQRKALDTQGESITQGMKQLWHDVQQGHVSQTDESVFEVGRNVATSEGSIVFENELFQLIDYKPLTAKVFERPMLFVPPCINKYYILDLQPDNSLIRYTVEQGHRVFVLSWRNADESISRATWDQYIEDAVIRAIGLVQEISGSAKINTLGFCIGGTILATALAVLAARGEKPAASVTLLTSFLDFTNTGILDLFIDENMVRMREMTLGAESPGGGSLLKGKELATTFSFLRPNDLVWNYVVGNYLKGEAPPPFDLLYWNGDSTNLPGPMYCWYLRNTYLENNLIQPGKVTVCGEKVDLGSIDAPAYLYASREDHIVPWEGAYRSTGVLKGKTRFVLGASGHIAGVINPPSKGKRSHWIGASNTLPAEAQAWFGAAKEHPGSWWTDWSGWLAGHAGKQIAAPKVPGDKKHKAIEPAPGRYVKQKA